jgi:hypothetical protein
VRQIGVDDVTYDKLVFAARVSGLTVAEVVQQLTSATGGLIAGVVGPPAAADADGLSVYVVYKGVRVSGALDLSTERLRITEGPPTLAGRDFRSPTQAAVETVKVLNPHRERPETNGWRFWKDVSSDRIIDSLRRDPVQ